jgi:hypothetical protein
MSRQKLDFLAEWWDKREDHDEEPCCSPGHCPPETDRTCGTFYFGPNGSGPRDVLQFEPPTKASLDEVTIYLGSNSDPERLYIMQVVFLGDGKLRATVPRACTKGYRGHEKIVQIVGIWFDIEKSKRERIEPERKRKEEESKYESSPKATDYLKPWNHL